MSAQITKLDTELYVYLVSILETYLTEEEASHEPFLINNGVKIIL